MQIKFNFALNKGEEGARYQLLAISFICLTINIALNLASFSLNVKLTHSKKIAIKIMRLIDCIG